MIRYVLHNYHWFVFSVFTIVLGTRFLINDKVLGIGNTHYAFDFMNHPSTDIAIIIIGVISFIAYCPWPERFSKGYHARLQTIMVACLTMTWSITTMAYMMEGLKSFFSISMGILMISHILVRAYIEPYQN